MIIIVKSCDNCMHGQTRLLYNNVKSYDHLFTTVPLDSGVCR